MLGKEFLLGEAMVARFGNLEAVFKKVNREREHRAAGQETLSGVGK